MSQALLLKTAGLRNFPAVNGVNSIVEGVPITKARMDGIDQQPKTRILFLLAAIFFSRLLGAIIIFVLNGPSGFCLPDTDSYLRPAAWLLHGSFSSSSGTPELFRTPGYPLLLAPAVASGHPALVAIFENLLLATLSAWLIWIIAIELSGKWKVALWAVLLYCFEPVGFLYSEKILSDLLFSTQILLLTWFALRFLCKPTYTLAAAFAVVLGLATYTRPVSLFLGPWLVPFFLFFPRGLSWRKRAGLAAAFLFLFLAALAPWIARNIEVAGYRGFSAVTDVNLYFYSAAAVKANLEHKSFLRVQQDLGYADDEVYFRQHPEQRDWPEAQIFQFQRVEGQKIISQHWRLYALVHLRGCITVLFDPAATEAMKLLRLYPQSGGLLYRAVDQGPIQSVIWLFRSYPAVGFAVIALGLQLLLYYALGIAGLRSLPAAASILFISFCAYFVIVSGSATAAARFRMPIAPFVCIAAGAAIGEYRSGSAIRTVGKTSKPMTLPSTLR